jgi:hypothetical protein
MKQFDQRLDFLWTIFNDTNADEWLVLVHARCGDPVSFPPRTQSDEDMRANEARTQNAGPHLE